MNTTSRTCILVLSDSAVARLKLRMGTPPWVVGTTTDNRKFTDLRSVNGEAIAGTVSGVELDACMDVDALAKLLAVARVVEGEKLLAVAREQS